MGISVEDAFTRLNQTILPPNPDSDTPDEGLRSDSNSNPSSNDNTDNNFCTELQLEEMMLKKLELVYNEAIDKIIGFGYDVEVVMNAVLRNGYCNGTMEVSMNICQNTLAYLISPRKGKDGQNVSGSCGGGGGGGGPADDTKQGFDDLSQLRNFSLAYLVCLLRRNKPCLSRGDAMWCLLMCDLHVGRASDMVVAASGDGGGDCGGNGGDDVKKIEVVENGAIGVNLESCKFHGGWGFPKQGLVHRPLSDLETLEALQKEYDLPIRSVQKKLLMKKNVSKFVEEYKVNLKKRQAESEAGLGDDSLDADENEGEESLDTLNVKNRLGAALIVKKFNDLNIEGDKEFVPKDKKDEMISSLVNEIMELEKQVKERKDWANHTAIQAARKLCRDLDELKMLRTEKEENQRVKVEEPPAEDPTLKRISEMETALRKASSQVDRANLAVRRLELENAEIRAEMQASRLSASESVTMCLVVAKREKKYLKKLLAWEKQRAKLQEDITAEKKKITDLQEEMLQVEAAKKTAEAKWREELKAKERALSQAEEERRLKEAAEANNKRNHETLRAKFELDFQRYKDDLQRLEQELSHLKTTTIPDQPLTTPYGSHPHAETIASLLCELDNDYDEKEAIDRACTICKKDEVSVVFLPCAHQVLCGSCSDEYGKKGKAKCPTCRVPIEQRIRVFGASS